MPKRSCYIYICTNERSADNPKGSCMQAGAEAVRVRFAELLQEEPGLRDRLRVVRTSCLDNCSRGPTMAVYPDDVWYQGVQASDVDEIVERHVKGAEPVERLLLPPEQFD